MVDTLSNNSSITALIYMGISLVMKAWFLWLPWILWQVFKPLWLRYVRASFIFSKKYILLEVKVPREVAKSPKAMESVLAGIHGTRRMGNLFEQWWEGWVTAWFSFEIVGDARGVHIYVWTNDFFKRMLESHIYAQYPSCEIRVVDDYTKELPEAMPAEGWSMWGSEFMLTMPDAYPIKTYEEFTLEDISTKEEGRKVDPLAALMEFFGSLKGSERIWLQILVQPADDSWKKEGDKLVAKMIGKKVTAKPSFISNAVGAVDSAASTLFNLGATEGKDKKSGDRSQMLYLSPGERTVVEAVERNMAKLGFSVCVRWIYLAKKDDYHFIAVPGMFGLFKQFGSQNLNGFRPNGKVSTSVDYWFVNRRVSWRKNRLFNAYRLRSVFRAPYNERSKLFVLSTSELATIFHFPGEVAGAPGLERIEAKRGAPPPNLPI